MRSRCVNAAAPPCQLVFVLDDNLVKRGQAMNSIAFLAAPACSPVLAKAICFASPLATAVVPRGGHCVRATYALSISCS